MIYDHLGVGYCKGPYPGVVEVGRGIDLDLPVAEAVAVAACRLGTYVEGSPVEVGVEMGGLHQSLTS